MDVFDIGRIASRYDTEIAHATLHAVAIAVNDSKTAARCAICTSCAVELPPGFASVERFYCTDRRMYVDPDDGCTFGSLGNPMRGAADCRASIADCAAVNGSRWCY